ncbi:hypothetical protein D0T50_04885 [Bacteroides sp. 214]|uniref:hypothetical protein n=1 Tax=Bacteroides sp. 214 TaxID=2302935 RepID=UPI0013D16D4B|nr:hypothetical protein [Bacteroides sp. 214]NDW12224.1 hypothetical protein [Bacteroides sp. 214]
MRKNKIIGAMLIATIIAASCSDSLEPNSTGNSQLPKTITLGINTPAQTRLTHEYDDVAKILKVNWKQGDEVRVFGQSGYTDYKAEANGTNGKPVAFTISGDDYAGDGPYNIFYPAGKAGNTWDDTTIKMLGQIQTDASETEHLANYTFLAKEGVTLTDPSDVHLEHLTAILRFDLTRGGKMVKDARAITLSTQDNESLGTLQKADGTSVGTSKQLTLAIDATTSETYIYYMAVFPSMFQVGEEIFVSIASKSNAAGSYVNNTLSSAGKKYEAGYIYSAEIPKRGGFDEAYVYNTTGIIDSPDPETDGTYLIRDDVDLRWLAEEVNNGSHNSAGQKYKLIADIYIPADANWTPIGTKDNPFKGSFDGGGHTIGGKMNFSGATQYAGIFGNVEVASGTVTIENLHVTVDIEGTDIEPISGEESAYGGILGYVNNNATFNIRNCSYTGTINIGYKALNTGTCYIGGIVGCIDGNGWGAIDRCQAIGAINASNINNNDPLGSMYGYNGPLRYTNNFSRVATNRN